MRLAGLSIPAQAAANKRFGRFKDEDEKAVRGAEAKGNITIEGLKEIWKAYAARDPYEMGFYEGALDVTRNLPYSPEDITGLCIALAEFQDVLDFHKAAGLFLSALIANSPQDDFILPVRQFGRRIDWLGFHNTKNLTIIGDSGHYAGADMGGGSLLIKGDGHKQVGGGMTGGSILVENDASSVGDRMEDGEIEVKGSPGETGNDMRGGLVRIGGDCCTCGERMKGGSMIVIGNVDIIGQSMEGGDILVKGDCIEKAGTFMKGGRVVIEGDARGCIGVWMTGGEIRVEGSISRIGPIRGGKIYHKGKPVAGG